MTRALGQSPKELEVKLLVSTEDLELIRGSRLATECAMGAGSDRQLHSVYYDTPEHSLAKHAFSFRVRGDGKGFVQTLKCAPPGDKAFSRHEWETSLRDGTPDLALFPLSALGPVPSEVGGKPLLPLFSTSVQRHAVPLSFKGSRLELAFDKGTIRVGEHEEPLSEIEIELKKGDPARLYELALQFLDLVPLRWSIESKFDRGYALACGASPATSRAPASPLTKGDTVDASVAAILAACQRHLLANEAAAEDGRDPEGVHQMRVALRQMRAAFSLFRRELRSKAFDPFDREAKWMAHKLGVCRNWDVFETETLVEAKMGEERALREAAEPKRDQSYDALRQALSSRRYALFQLSLGHWIECHGWLEGRDHGRLAEPASKLAASPLSALLRKALEKGKNFDKLGLRKRHRLRVALKKLRYAAEFFQPLFRKRKARTYTKRLAALQKLLGKDSDAITTNLLLRELAENAPSPSLDHAADRLRRWQEHERRATAAKARKTWAKFKKTPPFW